MDSTGQQGYDEHQAELRRSAAQAEQLPHTGTIQVVTNDDGTFYVRLLATNGSELLYSKTYQGFDAPQQKVENIIHAFSNPCVKVNDTEIPPKPMHGPGQHGLADA